MGKEMRQGLMKIATEGNSLLSQFATERTNTNYGKVQAKAEMEKG
jgi:hypothetical protein